MAKGGAGRLQERVALSRHVEIEDGYGNVIGTDWEVQFETAASYTHLKGGEAVMASRLANKHPVVVRIRSSAAARAATADWKLTDVRTNTEYAIHDVTHDQHRAYIDLLCMSGVPI